VEGRRKRVYKRAPLPHKTPGPKVIRGNTKRCNCDVHQGEFIPLEEFWVFKRGRRAGKPMSQCKDALQRQQGRTPGVSGYVPLNRLKFVFRELESRIGRMETCRRAGISINFWSRMDRGITKSIQKGTAIKLIEVLRQCRIAEEARHKDSIRHGAAARGRKEKVPTTRKHFNIAHGDDDADMKRNYRKKNPDYERTHAANQRARKSAEGHTV
jgi:hypothetical protein